MRSGALTKVVAESPSEKKSLAAIVRDFGPLGITEAVDVTLDICEELATAHASGVVHGDLGLHRVRLAWPRSRKQRVEIFGLVDDDTAAMALRASSVGMLVAPEQREGALADRRADVWAVGAILHAMVAGIPLGADEASENALAHVPRTVRVIIERCLERDPTARPQSVDEVAEVLGSFASSPPERFEQLARRRAMQANAQRDLGDVESVLGRLDAAAFSRELSEAAARVPPPLEERLVNIVQERTGSAIFETANRLDPLDAQRDIETVVVQSPTAIATLEMVVPLPLASPALASPLLTPPAPTVSIAPVRRRASSAWTAPLLVLGAVAAIALGVGIGVKLVERLVAHSALSASHAPTPSAPTVDPPHEAATPSPVSSPPPSGPTPPTELAASSPTSPASKPDMPVTTPNSLPNARRVTRAASSPKREQGPPRLRGVGSAAGDESFEVSSTSLSDALR